MSGLCGIINFDGAPVDPVALCKMAQVAAYRGPDGIRYWVDANVGLAHLALNLTPESWRESQPVAQGDLVLVADARIDNWADLLPVLKAKGYLLGPEPTDADLILAAYRLWGTDCPAHLIGDFAFAIWDRKQQHLFAARDVMGLRALYYRLEPQRLLFATEIQQILAAPDVSAKLFEPAVGAHLIPDVDNLEWTFYEGILQLSPGQALLVHGAEQRTWRYWDIDPGYRLTYKSEEEYAEHLLELLKEAVRCRLRSVKPMGIFLSGGLDSGSIASIVGYLRQGPEREKYPELHAFCWAFEKLSHCDERPISDGIARQYDIPVTSINAETFHPLYGYPAHGPHKDEPFLGHFQPMIETALAAAQAKGLGAVFFGARGDLTMGGEIFDYLGLLKRGQWLTLYRDLRAHNRRTGSSIGNLIMWYLLEPLQESLWPQDRAVWLRKLLRRPLPEPPPPWVRPEFAERLELVKARQPKPGNALDERYHAVFSKLNMRLMVWLERTVARFGMGIADPWSDRRIASFSLAVPQRLLNGAGRRKLLVRRAMRGIMPEEVRQTAHKVLPSPLIQHAFQDWAQETILHLISDPKVAAYGYVDKEALRAYYESYCQGERRDPNPNFWYALTLEMWLRQHWD